MDLFSLKKGSVLHSHYIKKLKLSNFTYILICYVIIVIVQLLYTKYKTSYYTYNTLLDSNIKFNNDHKKELTDLFVTEITNRANKLTSGKWTYAEWKKYNMENLYLTFKGHKYYFFSWEKGNDGSGSTYTNVFHANKKYEGLNWTDIYKDGSEQFVFVKQTLDEQLIQRMFELGKHGVRDIKYYWPDFEEVKPVEKESQIIVIPAGPTYNELVFGIGMDIDNLNNDNTFYYVNYISPSYIILISVLTLVISCLIKLFATNSTSYKCYLFLIATNIYLLYFLNNTEYHGTSETELKKIDQINSGILSVSFLVGINTFIITALTQSSHKDLFIQSAIIFSLSLILLLFSAFKKTDSITISQLMEDRLSNQLIYNFSIFLNIFVILNYVVFIFHHPPRKGTTSKGTYNFSE